MVTPRGRFCHRHTCLQWKYLYSGHCGSILQVLPIDPPQESAYGYGDSRAHVQPRLQVFRPSRRYCFRPGSSVYLPCMEELLQTPRCDRKSVVWISPSDQWADGEEDPGNRTLPANLLPRPPGLLAEYAQNSLHQSSTGLTPFQCVLGFQPPMFPWTREPSDVPAVDFWFRESERVWDEAHHHLQ